MLDGLNSGLNIRSRAQTHVAEVAFFYPCCGKRELRVGLHDILQGVIVSKLEVMVWHFRALRCKIALECSL